MTTYSVLETEEALLPSPVGRRRRGFWDYVPFAVAALVAVPVVVVLCHVFVPAGEVWTHLAETVLGRYVTNTIWLFLGVGIGTAVIGVGTAWLCSMCRFPGRPVFEWALLLPLAVPTYAIGFTYAGLFEYAGPVQSLLRSAFDWGRGDYWFPEPRSLGGAIAVMTLVLYPYVYLLSRAAFLSQSVCVLEVSRTLGRSPFRSFLTVALPLARPAIVGGVSLALMEALSDFGTVHYYGVDTFTTGIYRTWFGFGEPAAAAQLAAMLMVFVLALILLERSSRGSRRFHHTSARYRQLPGYALTGVRKWLAVSACLLPVLLGFLVPFGQLGAWTIATADKMLDASFFALAWNSVSLATITAVIAVCVALLVAYALRLRGTVPMRAAARAAGLGYAVPGSVIAVGVLLPFAWLDNRVDALARDWLGVSTGLLLTGTILALVFAYLVRFLAVSLNTVEASLGRVTPSMDGAARSLGASPGRVLFRVHMPMVAGGLMTAGLLVFVDVMKELPATLIMRPFDFNTLAVKAYELASDERLADSASAALAIVVVGIAPVVLLSRAITRSRPGGEGP
ncbi:MAG: iron ABC transporter permease [Rhodospirillaceae bacterium]|nr:iron ABC transporter permease [Rhodospirillaceae bacterium]